MPRGIDDWDSDDYLDDPLDSDFERDDFDYWGDTVQQLRNEALSFSAPMQDTMRLTVMKMRQHFGDEALRMPTYRTLPGQSTPQNLFEPYRGEFETAGVPMPQTFGDVQNYLARSMYPAFIGMAHKQAQSGQGFFESFSDLNYKYLESLGAYQPTTQSEFLRGTRTSFYGATELQRAQERASNPGVGNPLMLGAGGEIYSTPRRTSNLPYMGGDDFIFKTSLWRWEEATGSMEYEESRPQAMSISFRPFVPSTMWESEHGAQGFYGPWKTRPWKYGEAKQRYDYSYLEEGNLNPAPWESTGEMVEYFRGSDQFNWRYQTLAASRTAKNKSIGNWIINIAREGQFDYQFDAAQQATYKAKNFPTIEQFYPELPAYQGPHQLVGDKTYRENWSKPYFHYGISQSDAADEAYRANVLMGRIQNRTYYLPAHVGQQHSYVEDPNRWVEGAYTVTQRPPAPKQLGPGTNLLLPPGQALGENQFYGGPATPIRNWPMGMPAVAGAPRTPTHTGYARQAVGYTGSWGESIYAGAAGTFHVPPEEEWELRKREVGDTYMALNPRTGAWEEEVPGENQYFGDYGTEHVPPPASPAQPRDYQGWLDAVYYGGRSPVIPQSANPASNPYVIYTDIQASGGRMGHIPFSNRQSYYSQRGRAGGGPPGGGPPPPTSYDYIPPEPPPPGDIPVGRRYHRNEKIQLMLDKLATGESVMGSLRPGFGKTEAMAGAAELSPVSIVTSPLTALNEQHAKDLAERGALRDPEGNVMYDDAGNPIGGLQVFNLIGDPGEGKDRTEYNRVHQAFREAVFRSIDPETKQLREGFSPVVGIMSMEKLASLDPERGLGQQLNVLSRGGVLKVGSVDEAQEIGRGGRLLVKELIDNMKRVMPDTAMQLLGGTIPTSQEHMLANLAGISSENIFRAPASMGHLNVEMENVAQSDYVATGGRMAENAQGGQMIYGYSTRMVDLIAERAAEGGRATSRYHKGLGTGTELIPEAELKQVQERLLAGLGVNETVVGSSALGLGLNIPGVVDVGQVGVARPSDLIQRALRVRPGRLDSGEQDLENKVGTFRFAADPKQYEDWAKRAVSHVEALEPGVLAKAYNKLVAGGEWDPNWREASQQIDKRLGAALKEELPGFKGIEYFGGEASRILQEAGLLELKTVAGPGGEDIRNWVATGAGMESADIVDKILGTSYRSEFDPSQRMGFRDFRTQQSEMAAREYRAMGSILRQTSGMDKQTAGKYLTAGLSQWLEGRGQEDPTERMASMTALENFGAIDMPRAMAEEYIQAVSDATQTLQRQVSDGKSMADAMKDFTTTVNDAAQALSGSPMAQTIAAEGAAGIGMAAPGQRGFWGQAVQSVLDLQAASGGGGGDGGDGRGDGRGRTPGGLNARLGGFGQALYGSYLASRYWRMFAEPSLQAMQAYGQMEGQLEPLQMFGQEGFYQRTGPALMQQRTAEAQMNLGRGAYQMFEPFIGATANLLQNDRTARLASGFGVAGGLAAGGALVSAMFPPLAPVAVPAGLIAGGIAAGYTAVRDASITNQEWSSFVAENPEWAMPPTDVGRQTTEGWGSTRGAPRGGAVSPQWSAARAEAFEQWKTTQDPTAMAQRLVDESGGAISLDQAPSFIANFQAARGTILTPENAEMWQQAIDTAQVAVREGQDPSQMVAGGANYAAGGGALPGTAAYADAMQQYTEAGVTGRARMERDQAWANQFAGQFSGLLGSMSRGRAFQQALGITDQTTANRAQSMLGAYASRWGTPMAPMQAVQRGMRTSYNVGATMGEIQLGRIAMSMTPAQQQFAMAAANMQADAGVITTGAQWGGAVESFGSAMAGIGASPNMMDTTLQAMGGDYQAMSFLSWRNPEALEAVGLPSNVPMYNQWGAPIQQTSGQGFLSLGQSLMNAGNVEAAFSGGMWGTGFTSIQGMDTSQVSTTAAFLNEGLNYTMSNEMVQAFHDGGIRGAQLLQNQRSYNNSMAGIGIQMAQIAAQERFLWGGGAWTGTPAPGSLWGLQDQQRALAYQSQMAEFAYTTERMETANQFAIRGENIQYARMTAGHDMQRFNIGFQREGMGLARQWGREDFAFRAQGMALQRGWAREDWQYEDQMRGLQYGWQMEDLDEAIRMSSGRERKQLVKQRERMGITHGMEEEQLEKVRERQEQMWKREEDQFNKQKERQETQWAREEEQFEKQAEYQQTLMELDVEQFDLNKESRETLYEMDKENLERRIKDYKKQQELQEQIIELQRNHQVESLNLQKAALGVQAQQLKEQKEMNDVMIKANVLFDDAENELGLIAKYGEVKNVFYAFRTMAVAVNGVSTSKINKIRELLNDLHQ